MSTLQAYLQAHPTSRWCACGYPLPAGDPDRQACRSEVCRRWRETRAGTG